MSDGPILFFDGVCGLCNHTVDFLMTRDTRSVLRFAPLQGETAVEKVGDADRENLSTVVLVDGAGTHRRTSAIVRSLRHVGGVWGILSWLLWVIPWPFRDVGYSLVSRLRYRLFGRKQSCRIPTPEERGRLLA